MWRRRWSWGGHGSFHQPSGCQDPTHLSPKQAACAYLGFMQSFDGSAAKSFAYSTGVMAASIPFTGGADSPFAVPAVALFSGASLLFQGGAYAYGYVSKMAGL